MVFPKGSFLAYCFQFTFILLRRYKAMMFFTSVWITPIYVLLQSNNFSSVILTMNYMTTSINRKFICFLIAFLVFSLLTCICFIFLFLKHHCHVIISCNPSINQSGILGLSTVVKNPKVKY